MFECTKISESINEGAVEPFYKNLLGKMSTVLISSGNERKSNQPTTYPVISKRTGNHRKRYLDHSKDRPKQTYLIRGPGHSSDECKVLGDFGSKYD